MDARIIGIDCATDDSKIGIALGEVIGGRTLVSEVQVCSAEFPAAARLSEWLARERPRRTLLAIDAPLGWPEQLAAILRLHRAGELVDVEANLMFRRETDRFVHRQLKKTPLDVGADRIARTAHAALVLLDELRKRGSVAIPLAWEPAWEGTAAIEVYPAATLLTRGMTASGYKKKHHQSERQQLADALGAHVLLPQPCHEVLESADALDAVVCVLAGADFAMGYAHEPPNPDLALREGWIWFASKAELPNSALQRTAADGRR